MGFKKGEKRTEEDQEVMEIVDQHFGELDNWQAEYEEQDEGYKYLAGVQYTPEDKAWWETQRRPTRVYNHLLPIFNAVLGDFLTSDQQTKVFPLPGGTLETAAAIEKLILHFNEENDYKYVFGTVGLAGIIKRGYLYPRFTDERFIDGSLVFAPMDEFEVGFDSRAKNYFIDDAWYSWRGRWLTTHEILAICRDENKKKRIKNELEDKLHNGYWDAFEDPVVNKYLESSSYVNEKEGKYFVLEWHNFKLERAIVALDTMTGAQTPIDFTGNGAVIDKKISVFRKFNPNITIIEKDFQKKKYETIVVPGLMMIIDKKESDIQDGEHDFIPFSAYNYGKKTINHFGIFKNAKDPQEGFNEWENTSEQLVKRIADPGNIWRPEYVMNKEQVRLQGRGAGVDVEVSTDTNISLDQIFKTKDIPKYPFSTNDQASRKLDFLQKVTGVTPNFFGGEQTKQENASLFAQRVRQAKQSLAVVYHNFQRTKARMYKKSIRIMQENYTTQRIFWITEKNSITGERDPKQFIINQMMGNHIINDLSIGRYRVIPEELDASQSAKAIRYVERVQIAQTVFEIYGARVPIEWLLGESVDLGDMQLVIDSVREQLAQTDDAASKNDALQTTAALQSLAQQRMSMLNSGKDKENSRNNNATSQRKAG